MAPAATDFAPGVKLPQSSQSPDPSVDFTTSSDQLQQLKDFVLSATKQDLEDITAGAVETIREAAQGAIAEVQNAGDQQLRRIARSQLDNGLALVEDAPDLLQGSYSNFDFDHEPINTPSQGSTFPVYKGVHKATGMPIVAKVIKGVSDPDVRTYAIDEVDLNMKTKQYEWMPIACFREAFEHEDSVYLVFEYVQGKVACASVLESASDTQRKDWFDALAFALACCHTNGVFHGDIADRLSAPTINAIVGDVLTLIDLGDSQRPTSQDEVQDALRKDMEGLETFAEYLYPEGVPEDAKAMYAGKNLTKTLSVPACKQFVAQKLMQAEYTFPAGWAGMLAVCAEAEQPSPLWSP